MNHNYLSLAIGRSASVVFVLLIAWGLITYPVGSVWLALGLIVYTLLLIRWPVAWLLVIPGLLPVLDFAPWTGRFFFDEFDLFLLTTLAFFYWRSPEVSTQLFSKSTRLLILIYAFNYSCSLLIGLFPWQTWDINALNNYYSNFNSIRVGKGFIFALLLLPLLRYCLTTYPRTKDLFGLGLLTGLVAVIVASCWERLVFPGLFNYTLGYRITALFSSMHAGGGHIDAFLVLTLPFIGMLFITPNLSWQVKALGGLILIAGLYVLMVTFSRGAYFGAVVALLVFMVALFICYKENLSANWTRMVLPIGLLVLIPMIAIPVFQGGFIQKRFDTMDQDGAVRMAHWQGALAMRDDSLVTTLWGMGLGSFPRNYLWRNTDNITPATYRIAEESGNRFLKLGSGDALYLGQRITIQAHTDYTLAFDIRGEANQVSFSVPICEKSLLYSFRCSWHSFKVANKDTWTHQEQNINTEDVGGAIDADRPSWLTRPVQLAVHNDSAGKIVDVDNISLTDSRGNNLLSNGDFSAGSDFWFFSTDNHQAGNIDNLWVHILFDQGWLGLMFYLLLLGKAFYKCWRRIIQRQVFAVYCSAALAGFMVIGFVDSPFDAPRLTLLFFLLLWLALSEESPETKLEKRLRHQVLMSRDSL